MTTTAAIFTDIRYQIYRIPAGVGRDAQSFKEEVQRTIDALEATRVMEATPAEPLLLRTKELAAEQAEDAGLWFEAVTMPEAYLQAALRKLTAIIESTDDFGQRAANIICTPTVPVTVGRNTQIVNPDTGCLTELGAALLNGKDAQIAELRKMIEREVG